MRHELLDKAAAIISGVFGKKRTEVKPVSTEKQMPSKKIHYIIDVGHLFDANVVMHSFGEDFFPPHGKRIS